MVFIVVPRTYPRTVSVCFKERRKTQWALNWAEQNGFVTASLEKKYSPENEKFGVHASAAGAAAQEPPQVA